MNNDLMVLLITQTWQIACVAIVVAIVVRCFAKDRPHLAHALWVLVLVKCVTPPVWSSPVSPFSWVGASQQTERLVIEKHQGFSRLASESSSFAKPLEQAIDPRAPIVVHVRSEPDRMAAISDQLNGRPLDVNSATKESQSARVEARNLADWQVKLLVAWPSLLNSVPLLWLLTATLGLVLTSARLAIFKRWIRTKRTIDCPEVVDVVTRLCAQLNIKRKVQVKVIDGSVGPAVMGVLQPTILLPASIVVDRDAKQLEPLIAHELIHIRRGDLWWAALQAITTNLFWFHPMVWLASRMVTREGERSCDEETITSLQCSPVVYANGLVEVLEHKHQLRVAPALPGVRPVDITSARLERVMRMENGSSRTPVWVWLVMLLVGAIVLPGAALAWTQEGKPFQSETTVATPIKQDLRDPGSSNKEMEVEDAPQEAEKSPDANQRNSTSKPESQPLKTLTNSASVQNIHGQRQDDSQWVYSEANVSKILQHLESLTGKQKLRNQTASQKLLSLLPCRYVGDYGEFSTPHGHGIQIDVKGKSVNLGKREPTMKIIGSMLYMYETVANRNRIQSLLQSLEMYGARRIAVEARFLTMPADQFHKLKVDWNMSKSEIDQADFGNQSELDRQPMEFKPEFSSTKTLHREPAILPAKPVDQISAAKPAGRNRVSSTFYVEKNNPVLHAIIDAKKSKEVLGKYEGFDDARFQNLGAPKVAMFVGQTASVKDSVLRPFVIGYSKVIGKNKKAAFQPIIRKIEDGKTLTITPQGIGDEFHLNCGLTMSKILNSSSAEAPFNINGETKVMTVQLPEVGTTHISFDFQIPRGKILLISSTQTGEDGKMESLVVMLSCSELLDSQEPLTNPVQTQTSQSKPNVTSTSETTTHLPVNGITSGATTQDSDSNKELPESVKADWRPVSEARVTNELSAEWTPDSSSLVENLPVLIVTSEASESKNSISSLQAHGYHLKFKGDVQYHATNTGLNVAGKPLSITTQGTGDEYFFIRADEGFISSATEKRFQLEFKGGVQIRLNQMSATADSMEWNAEQQASLTGAAKMKIKDLGFDLSADKITKNFTDGTIVLEGNAKLMRTSGGSPLKINSDYICWDPQSNAIQTQPETNPSDSASDSALNSKSNEGSNKHSSKYDQGDADGVGFAAVSTAREVLRRYAKNVRLIKD